MRIEIVKAFKVYKEAYLKLSQLKNPADQYSEELKRLKITDREQHKKLIEYRKTNTNYINWYNLNNECNNLSSNLFKLRNDALQEIYKKNLNDLNLANYFKLHKNDDMELYYEMYDDDYYTSDTAFEILPSIIFDQFCDKEEGVLSRSFIILANNENNRQSCYIYNISLDGSQDLSIDPSFENWELIHKHIQYPNSQMQRLMEIVNSDIFFAEWKNLFDSLEEE